MELFCFGLGYVGRHLAEDVAREGWRISGTTRHEKQIAALSAAGFTAWRFDADHPLPMNALASATHILSTIPPDGEADPVLSSAALAHAGKAEWIGYLSSTGVYGDTEGRPVDETAPIAPTSAHARARALAERRWRELAPALPVHVFRLAGIYGPGRSALDDLKAGTARRLEKAGHVFSRIHVEDIVRVLRASMARPNPGAVYNVADDEAAPSAEVIAYAAGLLGREPPPLVPIEEAVLSPMAASFWNDNRRVDNARIKRELRIKLKYPSYREGLRALVPPP